ncbi:MAG: hypothetical protein KGJ06_02650, partial [Pseudomonadota bacterium]|nr:hypothetical protein [Pseudomonadota bacterium]
MKHFYRWCRSQDGAVSIIGAFSLVLLIASAGAAIDMARAQIVEMRMQNALDAAGLAVGSEASTVNLSSEENKYFYANFPSGYMGTTITSLTITPNSSNSVISLSVAGTVNTV